MPANPDRKMVTIHLGSEAVAKLNALCGNKAKATGLVVHNSEMITDLVLRAHTEVSRRRERSVRKSTVPVKAVRDTVIIRLVSETIAKLNALCGDKAKSTGLVVHRSEMIADLIHRAHAEVRRERAG